MAEFCPDCLDKMLGTSDASRKFIISKELDLCEECGKLKPVVVRIKRRYLFAERFREAIESIAKHAKR